MDGMQLKIKIKIIDILWLGAWKIVWPFERDSSRSFVQLASKGRRNGTVKVCDEEVGGDLFNNKTDCGSCRIEVIEEELSVIGDGGVIVNGDVSNVAMKDRKSVV